MDLPDANSRTSRVQFKLTENRDGKANEYPRSALGCLPSLLVALLFAIIVGAPTGFSLLVLFQNWNRSLVAWLLVFPTVLGIGVLPALRRWHTTTRRRLSSFVGFAIVLLVIDGLIVFGGMRPRSRCTWEHSDEVAATTDLSPGLSLAAFLLFTCCSGGIPIALLWDLCPIVGHEG